MIDLLGHLRISVPTLKETSITFYGSLGYFMFIVILVLGLIGLWLSFKNIVLKELE